MYQTLNGYVNQGFDSIARNQGFSYDSPAGRTAGLYGDAATFGASFAFGGGEAKVVEELFPGVDTIPRGGSKLSDLGRIFTSSTNNAGGEIWTSVGTIARKDFSSMVNSGLYNGDVNVISGVHADALGNIEVDFSLYEADVAKWGNVPGVTVHNLPELTSEQINALLNQPSTTIGGFCNSEVVLAPFR